MRAIYIALTLLYSKRAEGAGIMINEKFRAFVAHVEQLPPEVQDQLADALAEALDDAQWQAQFDDPCSAPALDRLIEKAKNGPWLPWPSEDETR
jgi:hypothetical protein